MLDYKLHRLACWRPCVAYRRGNYLSSTLISLARGELVAGITSIKFCVTVALTGISKPFFSPCFYFFNVSKEF